MKVLSMWQPWATLVALGAKKIETRSWRTDYRGPIAIHAAKKWDASLADICRRSPHKEALAAYLAWFDSKNDIRGGYRRLPDYGLPFGMIVAVADLSDCLETLSLFRPGFDRAPNCIEMAFGDYSADRYAWMLKNIRRLREPLPWAGSRGLRDLPHAIVTYLDSAGFAP